MTMSKRNDRRAWHVGLETAWNGDISIMSKLPREVLHIKKARPNSTTMHAKAIW